MGTALPYEGDEQIHIYWGEMDWRQWTDGHRNERQRLLPATQHLEKRACDLASLLASSQFWHPSTQHFSLIFLQCIFCNVSSIKSQQHSLGVIFFFRKNVINDIDFFLFITLALFFALFIYRSFIINFGTVWSFDLFSSQVLFGKIAFVLIQLLFLET